MIQQKDTLNLVGRENARPKHLQRIKPLKPLMTLCFSIVGSPVNGCIWHHRSNECARLKKKKYVRNVVRTCITLPHLIFISQSLTAQCDRFIYASLMFRSGCSCCYWFSQAHWNRSCPVDLDGNKNGY